MRVFFFIDFFKIFSILCHMGYVSARKIRIQTQLANVQLAIENLYTLQLEMSTQSVDSYGFDSGEGSQRTTRKKMTEIQDQIDRLEAKERHLINELYNIGIVNIRLRRKRPIC